MKKIKVFLVAALIGIIFQPLAVIAHAGEDHGEVLQAEATSTSRAEQRKSIRQFAQENREQRLEKYKANLEVRLTTAERNRLKARCQAAQALVKGYLTRSNALESNRDSAYSRIEERLSSLAQSLTADGHADLAEELNSAIDSLKQKTDATMAAIQDYKQIMTDLSELDCLADPEAFKAALEQARAARVEVFNKAKDIRTYITETVIPLLQSIKSRLDTTN